MLLFLAAGLTQGETIKFNSHPSTLAHVHTTLWEEGGLKFTAIPGTQSSSWYHTETNSPDFPYNGSPYMQIGGTLANFKFERTLSWTLIALQSVDLAEYSTVYAEPRTFTFVGYKPDGSTVTQSFTIDGVLDGNGSAADFETFQFDASFSGLTKVDVTGDGTIDNIVYTYQRDPSVLPPLYSVEAGADQRVPSTMGANLSGSFVNDGINLGPITVVWTVDLGAPGTVVFGDASQLRTTATFSVPGEYRLKLTVSDGERTGYDYVTVIAVDTSIDSTLTLTRDGQNYSYTLLDCDITATYQNDVLIIRAGPRHSNEFWNLKFRAPYNGPLAEGDYLAGDPFPGPIDRPGISVTSPSISTGAEYAGTFEVKKIVYDGHRRVASFWATFRYTPLGSVITGEIKVNVGYTLPSLNQTPSAHAGQDLHMLMGRTVSLQGGFADDVVPTGGHIVSWTQVEGPTAAGISNPSGASTDVTCKFPGIYTLRFAVSDGERSHSDDVLIYVSDPKANTRLRFFDGVKTHKLGPLSGDYSIVGGPNYVSIDIDQGELGRWTIEFIAPEGRELAPGFYNAPREFEGGALFRIDSPHSTTFYGEEASFLIRQLELGEDGSVIRFWATFEVEGYYRGEIRINASRNEARKNYAPIVMVGDDETIPNLGVATVRGRAVDDGGAKRLKTRWRKVSGPGTANFKNPSALTTEVSFSTPGTYVLALVASDGSLSGSDQLTITQTSEVTSLWVRNEPGFAELTAYLTPRHGEFRPWREPFRNGVEFDYSPYGDEDSRDPRSVRWTVEMAGAEAVRLAPGAYVGASSYYTEGKPFFRLYNGQTGETPSSAGFYVHQIEYDQSNMVSKLWATFRAYGMDTAGEILGEIRYNTEAGPLPPTGTNDPPSVDAGQSRTMSSSTTLEGSVADDGGPYGALLSSQWSVVSGPGIVTFTDISSPGSLASFSVPGTYVLRLTADDGEFSRSSEVTIEIQEFNNAPSLQGGEYSGVVLSQGAANAARGTMSVLNGNAGSFTGSVLFKSHRYGFSGAFSAEGTWTGTIEATGAPALNLTLAVNAYGQIAGTIAEGVIESQVLLDRSSGPAYQSEYTPGRYAFALLPDPRSDGAPVGNGFGLLTIDVFGQARYAMTLPDGSGSISGGGMMRDNLLPFQKELPGNKGSLTGRITFTETEDLFNIGRVECGGQVLRMPTEAEALPTAYSLVGARIRRSNFGVVSNPRSTFNFALRIRDRDSLLATAPLLLQATQSTARFKVLNPEPGIQSLNIGINSSSGLFQGKFSNTRTGTAGKFRGILLPDSRKGFGFSSNADGTIGAVEIQPYP